MGREESGLRKGLGGGWGRKMRGAERDGDGKRREVKEGAGTGTDRVETQ